MTEPLKVDTDELDAASAILKSAAGQIPTQLPQFSVNGSDPLSAAIAAGSAQIEAPMAALPQIKAEATTTAKKVGVAGQRYRETDETLAQKTKQQQLDKEDADAARGTHGGGIGKYKASPVFDKDLPTPPEPDFGQCFADNFKSDIGPNMATGVLTGGLVGAARGGLVGIPGGPLGVLGGVVLGFVGGAAGGAILSGPARTAVTSTWNCL